MRLAGPSAAVLLAFGWLGPLPELAARSFSAHMLLHVLVLAVAAPLFALAAAGGRVDPVPYFPRLFAPALTAALDFLAVWAWHTPALHRAAKQEAGFFALEQGSYLIAGLLVWLAALGGDREKRAAAGSVGLLLTSMHMALLGVLLALAGRPLFHHEPVSPESAPVFGLTALQDQQLGGIVMLVFGGSVYLAGALYLLAGLLRPERPAGQSTAARGKGDARPAR